MEEALSFDDMMRRRVRREPVAYILGRAHFRQLELVVDHRVLVPRPETELLVDLAENGQRVLDVGTGSGAIALAIAQERQDVRVTGIDNSPEAIDVARVNAERNALDVEFMIADLIVGGPYDLIVSNPPYVREAEWPGLAPEITLYEPREALLGGPDGLDVIRDLVPAAAEALVRGGRSRSRSARASHARSRRCSRRRACVRSRPNATWPASPGWCEAGVDLGRRRCGVRAVHRGGGVAVFPTDTLYGVGCRPDDEAAVARVYALKGRPPDKPSAVMYFSVDCAAAVGPRTTRRRWSAAPRAGARGAPWWGGGEGARCCRRWRASVFRCCRRART